MPPATKCPNPKCPFHADPTRTLPETAVVCPQCGTALAAQAIPRPRRGGLGKTVLGLLGVVFLIVFAVAAVGLAIIIRPRLTGDGPGIDESRVPEKNFAFRLPGEPWVRDSDLQTALGVNVLALRRDVEPTAWIALSVQDFETRSPQPDELTERMTDHLSRVFANLPPEPAAEPATWAGHDAVRWQFRGEHRTTNETCTGEAFAMHYKGVAYWFYAWAVERDVAAVAGEFEEIRSRFRTLELRENWTERVGSDAVFRSPSGKYRVSTRDAFWAAPPGIDPASEDPAAELLIRGELKGRTKRDFPPRAQLVVLVLNRPGEPMAVARDYIRARHSPDPAVFGPTEFTDQPGDANADPPVQRLKVSRGGAKASKSSEKLVVFSAIRVADAIVVAEGSCPWSEREAWQQRLAAFVGSLRP